MAGHSKFKNIQHRKEAQDRKRAKLFTKLLHNVAVAIKLGGLENNNALKHALSIAKSHNVPKHLIENSLNRSLEKETFEIIYEGFGKHGVGFIVEILTDNRNRAASVVRAVFNKYGHGLSTSNSVAFNFKREGHIYYGYSEEIENFAIENNVENVEVIAIGNLIKITTTFENFGPMQHLLHEKFGPAPSSSLVWVPISCLEITDDQKEDIIKLIEKLDEIEDVHNIYTNCNIDRDE